MNYKETLYLKTSERIQTRPGLPTLNIFYVKEKLTCIFLCHCYISGPCKTESSSKQYRTEVLNLSSRFLFIHYQQHYSPPTRPLLNLFCYPNLSHREEQIKDTKLVTFSFANYENFITKGNKTWTISDSPYSYCEIKKLREFIPPKSQKHFCHHSTSRATFLPCTW